MGNILDSAREQKTTYLYLVQPPRVEKRHGKETCSHQAKQCDSQDETCDTVLSFRLGIPIGSDPPLPRTNDGYSSG